MLKKIRINFKLLSTSVAGLALGISSLGALWESVYGFNGYVQHTTATIAAVILLTLSLRFIIHPQTLWHDLSHHVIGSVVPTFSMATMVVSSSLTAAYPATSTLLWLAAIVLHVIFLVLFLYHRFKDMQSQHMVPSWFVPPIGLIVAVFTCPQPAVFEPICYVILMFGIANYAVLLALMINRLSFGEKIPASAKSSIAILAAPASLCLAGYLAFMTEQLPVIVAVLLGATVVVTWVSIGYIKYLIIKLQNMHVGHKIEANSLTNC